MLLAACSSDEEPGAVTGDGLAVPLTLTCSVGAPQSRAFRTDTQVPDGGYVSLHIVDHDTPGTVYYTGIYCQVWDDELSDFYSVSTGEKIDLYFPLNGHAVDIYAVMGPSAWVKDFDWEDSNTGFAVEDSQTTIGGYAKSDLLFCKELGVKQTTEAVNLAFDHAMSKVEVQLIEGDGAEGGISGLSLLNLKCQAALTFNGSGLDIATDDALSSIDMQYTTVTDNWNEAVILPQTVTAGTEFISIGTSGDPITWAPSEDLVFEPGKKYRFNVTVSANQLTVAASVSPWLPTDDTDIIFQPEIGPEYNAIDMGLSVYWCDRNVGAGSVEGYGDYFRWGDPTPGPSSATWCWSSLTSEEWTNFVLTSEYDAATIIMGSRWRTPTLEEWTDLVNNTTCTIVSVNGVDCLEVTSLITGKSIFLPYTDWYEGTDYKSTPLNFYCLYTFDYVGGDRVSLNYGLINKEQNTLSSGSDRLIIGNELKYWYPIRPVYDPK